MPPKPASSTSDRSAPMSAQALLSTIAEASSSRQSQQPVSGSDNAPSASASAAAPKKKKKHRAGRKRNRRQSFAAPPEPSQQSEPLAERPNLAVVQENVQQSSSTFYRLGNAAGSGTSLDSEILLDHRDQNHNPRRRRASNQHSSYMTRSAQFASGYASRSQPGGDARYTDDPDDSDEGNPRLDDRAPLLPRQSSRPAPGYGGLSPRRRSTTSSATSRKRLPPRQMSSQSFADEYDVNNPPSVPGSPRLSSDDDFDDVLLPEMASPELSRTGRTNDVLIDIDSTPTRSSPRIQDLNAARRRQSGTSPVEDVCLPFEQLTEIGEEEEEDEYMRQDHVGQERVHRRHRKVWPDVAVLDEWSREEKEQRTMEGVRAKKENEPVLIGGRLRPQRGGWRREEEEEPFRWTYFNEEFDSSLRSHTISGLQQLGHSFTELFIPDPPEIEDDSSSSEDDEPSSVFTGRSPTPNGFSSKAGRVTRQSSILDGLKGGSKSGSGDRTPSKTPQEPGTRMKRYGPRPVFWLDVLQPTWDEMRVLSRAFGIHKLTAEDIMEQEAREKVELFRNYYFVNYRTFEQDDKSQDFLDPVNMYFIVFKGGVISFHFSQMPHPPNVRRRIRQLAEHQYTDSDWIAYAIIDNITDAYAPLIEQIEQEVDNIDDEILLLHHNHGNEKVKAKVPKVFKDASHEKGPACDEPGAADTSRDMLLRVGECRKKVMGLYRLLGNKADVIKGLAKRCNEQWSVAPRSDVGLYLGDIQDHIVTMTGNLTHYESILSRSHSNYLAQINIGMNERAEQTNDVLGKLTVLGTIVLPMNIITGVWGMNCLVPGQVEDNPTLVWFFCLTGFLVLFGLTSFFVAKKVYKIV